MLYLVVFISWNKLTIFTVVMITPGTHISRASTSFESSQYLLYIIYKQHTYIQCTAHVSQLL